MDHPIPNTKDALSTQIIIPQKQVTYSHLDFRPAIERFPAGGEEFRHIRLFGQLHAPGSGQRMVRRNGFDHRRDGQPRGRDQARSGPTRPDPPEVRLCKPPPACLSRVTSAAVSGVGLFRADRRRAAVADLHLAVVRRDDPLRDDVPGRAGHIQAGHRGGVRLLEDQARAGRGGAIIARRGRVGILCARFFS